MATKYKEYAVMRIAGQSPAGGSPDAIANTYLGNWNLVPADGNPANLFMGAMPKAGLEALLKIKMWEEGGKNRFSLFVDTRPVVTNLDRGIILSPTDLVNLPETFEVSVQGNYIYKMRMMCGPVMSLPEARAAVAVPIGGHPRTSPVPPQETARVEHPVSVAEHPDGTKVVGQVLAVPLKLIRRMQDQPRKDFDPDDLRDFGNHLKEEGQLQPAIIKALVEPDENGCVYELTSGERRWRSCGVAGIPTLNVIVSQPIDDTQQYVDAVVANCHAVELTLLETIQAVYKLSIMGKTDEEIAKIFGKKSEIWATERRKAITLEVEVLKLLGSETPENMRIPFNTAKLLIGLPAQDQLRYARMASKAGMPASKLNYLIKNIRVEQGLHTRQRPDEEFTNAGRLFRETNARVEILADFTPNQLAAMFKDRDGEEVRQLLNSLKDVRDNLAVVHRMYLDQARMNHEFVGK